MYGGTNLCGGLISPAVVHIPDVEEKPKIGRCRTGLMEKQEDKEVQSDDKRWTHLSFKGIDMT